MAKQIKMENLINTARNSLRNGASLVVLQEELKRNLEILSKVNNYTDSQIETYNTMIENLDKPVQVTSANYKKLTAISAGLGLSLIVVGTIYGVQGCSKNPTAIESEYETNDTNKEETESESVVETETEEEKEVNYVLPEYLNFDVNDPELIINNMSEFLNNGLTNGLTSVEENGKLVSGITEDNLSKKIESYLCMYVMANMNNIDYKLLANLNQQGNLTADVFYEKAITAMRETYYDAISMQEGQTLDVEKLFADKNDVEYIKKIEDLIIKYNNAEVSERKEIISEGIKIKENLLTYSASKKTEINPFALDYAFTRLDALNLLTNGAIITDNEADIGLYNAVLKSCVTEEQIKEWNLEEITLKTYDVKGDSRYALLTILREMERVNIIDKMQMALDYANVNEISNVETSFNYIVSEIAKNVDLNTFVANEYSYSNWLYMIRNKTDKTVEEELKNSEEKKEEVKKDNVKPKDVPKKDRVPEETTGTVTDEKGNTVETTVDYVKAKAEAQENASKDAADEYKKLGTSLTISMKSIPSKPDEKKASYKEVYDYYYAIYWNESLTEFQNMEKAAIESNSKQKENYEELEEPKVTEKSENYEKEKPKDEVTFIEEAGVTVIDEGIITDPSVNIKQVENYFESVPTDESKEQGTIVDEGILLQSKNYSEQLLALREFKEELLNSVNNSFDSYINESHKMI